jgi:allantoicase
MASKRTSHCGKRKHHTLLAAQIVAKRTLARSRKGDPIVTPLVAYKCQHCDGWHVGRDRQRGLNWAAIEAAERALRERIAAQRKGA